MSESTCRRQVRERSNGVCERCGHHAEHMHHRKNRSQGGKWTFANCVHLCAACHHLVTVEPLVGQRTGLCLTHEQDPEAVPVLLRDQWSLLYDDGIVEWVAADVLFDGQTTRSHSDLGRR